MGVRSDHWRLNRRSGICPSRHKRSASTTRRERERERNHLTIVFLSVPLYPALISQPLPPIAFYSRYSISYRQSSPKATCSAAELLHLLHTGAGIPPVQRSTIIFPSSRTLLRTPSLLTTEGHLGFALLKTPNPSHRSPTHHFGIRRIMKCMEASDC